MTCLRLQYMLLLARLYSTTFKSMCVPSQVFLSSFLLLALGYGGASTSGFYRTNFALPRPTCILAQTHKIEA